ncbi:hypothetical protein ACFFX0_07150 [Citricoccus parietis]|uniref:Uncharacterized protein n=1 Tax=Citricoccus parietis TaxID=592307 RepID=A0ABV5FWB6_9MICC
MRATDPSGIVFGGWKEEFFPPPRCIKGPAQGRLHGARTCSNSRQAPRRTS